MGKKQELLDPYIPGEGGEEKAEPDYTCVCVCMGGEIDRKRGFFNARKNEAIYYTRHTCQCLNCTQNVYFLDLEMILRANANSGIQRANVQVAARWH